MISRREIDAGVEDDQSGFGMKVLDDLVQSLHLSVWVFDRLVLSSRGKLFRGAGALGDGGSGSADWRVSISGVVGSCRIGLFRGGGGCRGRWRAWMLMHGEGREVDRVRWSATCVIGGKQ